MGRTRELELIDIYAAAFLTLHGQEARLILRNGRVIFCFKGTDEAYQLTASFNGNVQVPCLDLVTRVKVLRGKILTMKENEKGHGGEKGHGTGH
jgi:hypothetical protein